jgi:UDP-N-acetylmuramoyl-L-alanyl-D-glutamate--2,6-diaminopimelate ligase
MAEIFDIEKIDVRSFKGITQDSRAVKTGYLFAALPGSRVNGEHFMIDAVNNGAAGILMSDTAALPEDTDFEAVKIIRSPEPRKALAHLAAAFYGLQPSRIAAVTGTNGKTSTVTFAEQIWRDLGLKAASLGTLGLRGSPEIPSVRSGSMTTPDPVSLHAELADLASAGITHLAMEASSHGLDQCRLDGVRINAAGFTNLSRDHLDYHSDMDDYLGAKIRLFRDVMQPGGVAALNADVAEYDRLEQAAQKNGHRVLSYGAAGKDLKILSHKPTASGQNVALEIMGRRYDLVLPLVGQFQLMNALCAAGLVIAEYLSDPKTIEKIVKCLDHLKGVPGRLELVPGHVGGAVYVDYAHTPDALQNVLKALRPHTHGRLYCLFGCGGDRDSGKRPLMGGIARTYADHVIVTDDNPRSENPAQIRKDIMAGAPGASEIAGRRAAIEKAIQQLSDGDVLVIAGKGHEQGQIFDGYIEPFDDVEVASSVIEKLRHG